MIEGSSHCASRAGSVPVDTRARAFIIAGVIALIPKPSRAPAKVRSTVRFSATLHRPRITGRAVAWTFLRLPPRASAKLPSRGLVSVRGTLNGAAFRGVLEPDGQGGHWFKVDRKTREAAGAQAGETVSLEVTPTDKEPEPKVPSDFRAALTASPEARAVWTDITPLARRDWIHWIVSAKQEATRARRIGNACSMLTSGKRRPCCFDRSGMYSKSLSCPEAEEPTEAQDPV